MKMIETDLAYWAKFESEVESRELCAFSVPNLATWPADLSRILAFGVYRERFMNFASLT